MLLTNIFGTVKTNNNIITRLHCDKKNLDVVDEVIHANRYNNFRDIRKKNQPFGEIQVVACGDFYQVSV